MTSRCAHTLRLALLLMAGFVSLASPTWAQAQGFSLNRFEPAERGSDWFTNESLDLRGHLRPAVGLTLDWANKPLVVYDRAGNEVASLVDSQLYGHLGAALTLWDRVRLGINVPVLLSQSGQTTRVTVAGQTLRGAEGAGVGDLRLGADVRILGEYGDAFSLAAGVRVFLPTGSEGDFSGDGTLRLVPRALVAGDVGMLAYAARLALAYRPNNDSLGAVPLGSELTFGAAVGLRFLDRRLLVGPEVFGSTVIENGDAAFATGTSPLEFLFGGHYRTDDWRFGLGVGPGLSRGLGAPEVRVVGSLEWHPGVEDEPLDSDGDGIFDIADACPDVPGIESDKATDHGCPDSDGDGIFDGVDACVDVPGVASDDEAEHGCPKDSDDDGILDEEDACVDVAGAAHELPEKHGCPRDGDGDGIFDADDACPETPGVANDDHEKHGCPIPGDADGDSIVDDQDACPAAAGEASEDPEKHGCPVARVEAGQIRIIERVEFETSKATIREVSIPVLEAVLAVLEEYEGITLLRVEGHTDSKGRRAFNKDLSERRARAVRAWLISRGVAEDRLLATGYGMERPLASNKTRQGRQANRRVEFHILREDGDPPATEPAADESDTDQGDE